MCFKYNIVSVLLLKQKTEAVKFQFSQNFIKTN